MTQTKYPDVRAAYRKARGDKFSQEALADLVGTSRRHIIRIENGEHRPTLAMRDRIARALGVPADSLPTVEDDRPFRAAA